MTEKGVAHLEEFLDSNLPTIIALVALPHDVQRVLTRLREQEALTQQRHQVLYDSVKAVLAKKKPTRDELDGIKERLTAVISVSDEKVALARNLHQTVQHHVKHLEDEICCFEEEVRLARTYGELDDEEPDEPEDAIKEGKRSKRKTTEDEPMTSHSPRQASSPAEFDSIPEDSMAATRKNRRSDSNTTIPTSEGPKSPMQRDAFTAQEPTYCYCNQVSFGEMVGCDNHDCDIEWFHYGCVGLTAPPPGKWYCPDCSARDAKNPKLENSMKKGRGAFSQPN